ncbi:MAG: M48 family metalloprotease [Cyanobacteriota bacterium]|nr:M48 family metalloprotease [Cyanobacteriota bacterium]
MILETLAQYTSVAVALCALTFAPLTTSVASAEEATLDRVTLEGDREEDTTGTYDTAKTELPENFYVLYRIVDRLARANDLDDYPWRVTITDNDNISAYATEANVIVIASGLLDRMAGDASSLACVVGHEMAHHLKSGILDLRIPKPLPVVSS